MDDAASKPDGSGINLTGSIVAILIGVGSFAWTVLDRSGQEAAQAVRDTESRLTAMIEAVERRAKEGRDDINGTLLDRSIENRANIEALDRRLGDNIVDEQRRNNRLEREIAIALTKLGIYNGTDRTEPHP